MHQKPKKNRNFISNTTTLHTNFSLHLVGKSSERYPLSCMIWVFPQENENPVSTIGQAKLSLVSSVIGSVNTRRFVVYLLRSTADDQSVSNSFWKSIV